MGQDVNKTAFTAEEFFVFQQRLDAETEFLREMLETDRFSDQAKVTGFELEGWLLDHNYFPASVNQEFLHSINNSLVVSELSRFNFEINGKPQFLTGNALFQLQLELEQTIENCRSVANSMNASVLLIGTLPTLRNADLSMANMTPMNRYQALNKQVFESRKQKPILLDIAGKEHLKLAHHDVMLEAGTTSFQVHLQTPLNEFVRHFNASLILSAPLIAATANSPYLFGKDLWSETRIPLFEQAISTSDVQGRPRVSFGEGYIQSALDGFFYNQKREPVLLPFLYDDSPDSLRHLRLHNGTIWRWNRPLIGFNEQGIPHVRIEHRIMPAGPSVPDMIANAALYLGTCTAMAAADVPAETQLEFSVARDNFYRAAKDGLSANITWLDGKFYSAASLLLDVIIPLADAGLATLNLDADQRDYYISLLKARISSRQTGTDWQRAFIRKYGADFFNMTATYQHYQQSGKPVHEWEI